MTQCGNSARLNAPSRTQVSRALALGLMRAATAVGGRGTLADIMETSGKTVDRALLGDTVPHLHTAFAALLADPTALDEVAALFGFAIRPLHSDAANDAGTAAALARAAGSYIEAIGDGRRDHRETLVLADMFRPLVMQMAAVIEEADRIRRSSAA